jgi:beta-galactosidase
MKSFFKPEENVCHIAIIDRKGDQMWNGIQTGNDGMSDHWNRMKGQNVSLIVYTNAEEVEILLNGKSLGKKRNDVKNAKMRNQIRWNDVPYEPGKLIAIARNNGEEVCRHSLETTGEAVELVALDDDYPTRWQADGMDLQHIKVVAVDKRGRTVQTTDKEVTFTVEGPADIVGVINGDINSDELTVGKKRRLYQGNCTLILRSQKQHGRVVVKAEASGMKPAKLKFNL